MIEEREDIVVNRSQYPSNSHKKRPVRGEIEKRPEVKLEKVITGTVTQRKRGVGSKLKEAFLGDNTKSVGDYIIYDVLVPSIKRLISDMVGGGIETLMYGSRQGRHTTRDGSRSYMSYSSFGSVREDRGRKEISYAARARHDFDEIVFTTRGDAEEVLSQLVDLTVTFGAASVADLYALSGIESEHTDNKYGWADLRHSNVDRVRNGYILNLPRPVVLD